MIVLAALAPNVIDALYGGCIAGGLIVGGLVALVNSWRV